LNERLTDPGPPAPRVPPLVIITGLSGAGKSTAMRVFEDLGRYCIDNLPPSIISSLYNLYLHSDTGSAGVVIASDVRSGARFDDFLDAVRSLEEEGIRREILFLDCSTHVLINRFSEVRRAHPRQHGISIRDAIDEERRRLQPIRAIATSVIDTSTYGTPELRQAILRTATGEDAAGVLRLKFLSFGFKYGVPRDADFVFDVRFLPNPFYEAGLRGGTGEDREVFDFVMSRAGAEPFFQKVVEMIELTVASFVNVGKLNLTLAMGCTGGRHRSVAFARRLADHFTAKGRRSEVLHRDVNKLTG